jgi:hypothetical protein
MLRAALIALGLGLCPNPAPSDLAGGAGVVWALEEPQEVSILDLTTIDWSPGEPLPERIQALNNRRVVIRGYMHQSVTDTVNRFPLVSDACQCVGALLPHHFVEVNLGPRNTGPIPGCFEVIGTLEVGEVVVDDFVQSVYRLKGRIY